MVGILLWRALHSRAVSAQNCCGEVFANSMPWIAIKGALYFMKKFQPVRQLLPIL
jgi:hypothetical protein